jgi:molybdopterin-guanine dinucleotide biosynthesis protein A
VPARDQITVGILAGGQARRLAGADKAGRQFRGQSLLARTLESLGEGFAATLLSHNGVPGAIIPDGMRVLADLRPGFPGPLAGLEALLQATATPWLLTLPVDLRDPPPGLPELLSAAQAGSDAGVVLADADGLQPLVALWPVPASRLATSQALAAGQLAVHALVSRLAMRVHDISPSRLGNLNTPADFE